MNRVQRKLIDEITEAFDMGMIELSEFESEFMESMRDRPDDYELSSKQNSVLNKISQKQFSGFRS
jgi:hypothetical protein